MQLGRLLQRNQMSCLWLELGTPLRAHWRIFASREQKEAGPSRLSGKPHNTLGAWAPLRAGLGDKWNDGRVAAPSGAAASVGSGGEARQIISKSLVSLPQARLAAVDCSPSATSGQAHGWQAESSQVSQSHTLKWKWKAARSLFFLFASGTSLQTRNMCRR